MGHPRYRLADVEADGFSTTSPGLNPSVLATSLLRFQCLERAQASGEVALSASKSSHAGTGGGAGGLGLEQFPSLPHRGGECRRNRISVDSDETRADGNYVGCSPARRLKTQPPQKARKAGAPDVQSIPEPSCAFCPALRAPAIFGGL